MTNTFCTLVCPWSNTASCHCFLLWRTMFQRKKWTGHSGLPINQAEGSRRGACKQFCLCCKFRHIFCEREPRGLDMSKHRPGHTTVHGFSTSNPKKIIHSISGVGGLHCEIRAHFSMCAIMCTSSVVETALALHTRQLGGTLQCVREEHPTLWKAPAQWKTLQESNLLENLESS